MAKTYKLAILAPARAELHEIARLHMELVGVESARRITNRIKEGLDNLKQHPLMGAMFQDPELRRGGFRRLICGNYLCVYRLIEDAVFVYHIVDGRTNYPRLLSDLPNPKS